MKIATALPWPMLHGSVRLIEEPAGPKLLPSSRVSPNASILSDLIAVVKKNPNWEVTSELGSLLPSLDKPTIAGLPPCCGMPEPRSGRVFVYGFDDLMPVHGADGDVLDLHRFCSGLLRAMLSLKETGYGNDTQ